MVDLANTGRSSLTVFWSWMMRCVGRILLLHVTSSKADVPDVQISRVWVGLASMHCGAGLGLYAV
jgi:hypothetical protein